MLAEAGHAAGHDLVSVDATGFEAAADWADLRSAENYLGYARTDSFASADGLAVSGNAHVYAFPAQLELNFWALSGDWTQGSEAVRLNAANGRIAYRFRARDLNLVMAPPAPGHPVRFRVLIDGKPPGQAHGLDVDNQGNGTVSEPRTYQLIRQARPIVDRQFEIEFLDPGVDALDFTFG